MIVTPIRERVHLSSGEELLLAAAKAGRGSPTRAAIEADLDRRAAGRPSLMRWLSPATRPGAAATLRA